MFCFCRLFGILRVSLFVTAPGQRDGTFYLFIPFTFILSVHVNAMPALQRGKGKGFCKGAWKKQPFHVLIRCQWNKVGRKLYRTTGLSGCPVLQALSHFPQSGGLPLQSICHARQRYVTENSSAYAVFGFSAVPSKGFKASGSFGCASKRINFPSCGAASPSKYCPAGFVNSPCAHNNCAM